MFHQFQLLSEGEEFGVCAPKQTFLCAFFIAELSYRLGCYWSLNGTSLCSYIPADIFCDTEKDTGIGRLLIGDCGYLFGF